MGITLHHEQHTHKLRSGMLMKEFVLEKIVMDFVSNTEVLGFQERLQRSPSQRFQ